MWNLYLDSFPAGTNEVYRENRKMDCNCCKAFFRHYSGIVGIIDGKTISVWDIETVEPFQTVANVLRSKVESLPISDVMLTSEIFGKDSNYDANRVDHPKYDHLYYKFPSQFVVPNVAAKKGEIRQTKEVIERSFEGTYAKCHRYRLELIEDKSLYRGEEHRKALTTFKKLQKGWITSQNKENYCWEVAVIEGRSAAIRNTAIGTLLINISDGVDLETAVKKYESVVAPENYNRPKAIFTKSMREAAEKKVIELGLLDSLPRRYAKLEDISIQNVLWASGESQKVMKSPFDLLANEDTVKAKKFDHIEQMGINYFIENVLPTAKTVELYFDNSHKNKMVSLIAPVNPDAPSLFKWDNGFSWSYDGDYTDSIKDAVKMEGGKVDGIFNFRLAWNMDAGNDSSDLDAWAIEGKTGTKIGYSTQYIKHKGNFSPCAGQLDVDNTNPGGKMAVENITWLKKGFKEGEYRLWVNQYSARNSKGFVAEVEFSGQTHTFAYDKPLSEKENIQVATVKYKDGKWSINPHIKSEQQSREVWGVSTMKFIPVKTVLQSPNYWDENKGTGNKHFFFMLDGCVNEDTPRGFFNEFLRNGLTEHKRVFEALGAKMRVEHSDDQMSGLGFSSTAENSIVLKINSKPLKINFTNDELISKSSKAKVSVSN